MAASSIVDYSIMFLCTVEILNIINITCNRENWMPPFKVLDLVSCDLNAGNTFSCLIGHTVDVLANILIKSFRKLIVVIL